jgi:predicted aconitase with swiveling domain
MIEKTETVLSVKRATGPMVEGETLVSSKAFSPRYDINQESGTFSRPGHPLEGRSFAGKILFFPGVQGGVMGGWVFFELGSRGLAPAALVFGKTNPVMVQGAILAGIPILDGIDPSAFDVVKDGDVVRVDPEHLQVEIVKRASLSN